MSVDWEEVRREFPALANWTYLNTATFGQLPRRAIEAVAGHFAHRDELACGDFLDWYDDANRLRAKIGQLIRCDAEDIAFVPNASTALGLLLSGLNWSRGDRVVTLEHEFPNNLYAPSMLQRLGVEAIECAWEHFYQSIDSRTRLVALSSVNYNTGFAPPLAEISAFLSARGVLLYVDGTQSIGALRFDAGKIQPGMLAVHGYKWLLSPNGAGFFYIRPDLRERIHPNVVGWRSHRDWRNVDNLHHGAPELPVSAEKYEGGSVSFALLYAMEASIDLLLEIGPEAIEKRVLELAGKARRALQEQGAEVSDCTSPIIAARFHNCNVSALARALKQQRVQVAARRGQLRVSPHFYNNERDLEILNQTLRASLAAFSGAVGR
jgi:selenocysteine lyase/cysteine desulfurase